jgi:plastocyanin
VSQAARAGTTVSGSVVDQDGKGVEAIVWVDAPSGEKSKGLPPLEVRQSDKTFVPRMAVAEVGQLVRFPNQDQYFHNVFSASKGNAFDLGLFKADAKYDEANGSKVEKGPAAGEVRFKEAGRVDIFCNIHPKMSAVVLVVPHAYHARTDSSGAFRLPAPAKGKFLVHALDENGNETTAPLGAEPSLKLVFKDRKTDVPEHLNKKGEPYKSAATDMPY